MRCLFVEGAADTDYKSIQIYRCDSRIKNRGSHLYICFLICDLYLQRDSIKKQSCWLCKILRIFSRFDAGENGIPFEMNFESAFDIDVIGFSAFASGFVNSDVLLSASVYKSLERSRLRMNFDVVEASFL